LIPCSGVSRVVLYGRSFDASSPSTVVANYAVVDGVTGRLQVKAMRIVVIEGAIGYAAITSIKIQTVTLVLGYRIAGKIDG
jgi:hypothetical protein